MPVIRPKRRWDAPISRQTLIDHLAAELEGRETQPRPVIFETPILVNHTVHVTVVWPEWDGIPADERSSVILDAYTKYDASRPGDEPITPRITIAIGVTPDEARASDLLPFEVRPQADPESLDSPQLRDLMIQEGAIEFPTGLELRFPTRQMAADAHARLKAMMPEAHWAIIETVGTVDDWAWRKGI